MTTDCRGLGPADTLNTQHPRRADVLLHYLSRAIEETPLSEYEFAEQLAISYEARVAEHAREIKLAAPSASTARELADQLNACAERLRRYRGGRQPIPADLEEPWVYALPEPYSTQARRTLARRYGFMAAERPAPTRHVAAHESLGRISYSTAQTLRDMGQALKDGRFDADDAGLIADLDDLIGTAVSVRACVARDIGIEASDQVVSIHRGRRR